MSDIVFYRYDTPTDMCDHPDTEQRWGVVHDDSGNFMVTSDPITFCTVCNEIVHSEEDQ